jgi:hypothetical protein
VILDIVKYSGVLFLIAGRVDMAIMKPGQTTANILDASGIWICHNPSLREPICHAPIKRPKALESINTRHHKEDGNRLTKTARTGT